VYWKYFSLKLLLREAGDASFLGFGRLVYFICRFYN
jgi:hypothetical protein